MGLSAGEDSTPETKESRRLRGNVIQVGSAALRRSVLTSLARRPVTMQNANSPAALRRSSRVPINVPILVTSLEPGTRFSEVCETLVVNAHGCAMRSPVKLDAGGLLHFHSKEGRETTAKVVTCLPLDSDRPEWRLAARLDPPANSSGLTTYPADWAQLPPSAPTSDKLPAKLAARSIS